MQIYIQNTEKQTLKSIPYADIYKTRYDNGEYTKLFPSYDSTIHTIIVADTEPTLSNYELYLKGEYTLDEGEYIESESIAKAVSPSSYHTWDYDSLSYILTEENKAIAVADLKVKLATLKYTQQESLVITKANVDNLTASYNYLMLKESIESYEEGLSVRWKNLDGKRVAVDSTIIAELEAIKLETKAHYQKCFDTQELVEIDIDAIADDSVTAYDLEAKWDEFYLTV